MLDWPTLRWHNASAPYWMDSRAGLYWWHYEVCYWGRTENDWLRWRIQPLIFSQAHVWGICGSTRCTTSGKAVRIQRSTKSHSTLAALWKQSDLSCGGCSQPSHPGEPLPAHDETHGHGQCNCERKAAPTPCFPLGGIFLRAVSGFSLVRKCSCFSPHRFSLINWRARDRL